MKSLLADQIDISWYLSVNTAAPISFFRSHPELITWQSFAEDNGVREKDEGLEQFLEDNLKDLPWDEISSNSNIPESFLRRHTDKIIWECIGCNTNLSASFFEDHFDLLDLTSLHEACNNKHLSYDFIIRGLGEDDPVIFSAYNIPIGYVIKRLEKEDALKKGQSSSIVKSSFSLITKSETKVYRGFSSKKGDKKAHIPVDWKYLCSNLGFWIHLAEYELRPILQDVTWNPRDERNISPTEER